MGKLCSVNKISIRGKYFSTGLTNLGTGCTRLELIRILYHEIQKNDT